MMVNTKFKPGDVVCSIIDGEQRGLVLSITIHLDGSIQYLVSWGPGHTVMHAGLELVLMGTIHDDTIKDDYPYGSDHGGDIDEQ